MSSAHDAIAGLLEAVSTTPDRNDLGRLARMHSWCQSLSDAESTPAQHAQAAAVRGLARALLLLLERLILDEAANADLGTTLITPAVHTLEQLFREQAVEHHALLEQIREATGDVSAEPEVVPAELPTAAPLTSGAPAPTLVPEARATSARTAPPPAATGDMDPYVSEPLLIDLSERDHLQGFLDEAGEHMDNIETGLLEVEADPTDTGKINELFRPFHTIKGIAGFLNLRDINRLTHEIETILDLGRKNELRITAAVVDLVFAAVDVLKAQLNAIRTFLASPSAGPCPQPNITAIMAELRRAVRGELSSDGAASNRRKLGEILVAGGAAASTDVDAALQRQQSAGTDAGKLGDILVEQGVTSRGEVERALAQQATGKPLLDTSIRVDTNKLDLLVDAVGELVIAQSMVSLSDVVHSDDKLQRNVSQVTKIVRDVQETAMAMRMVQIGQTFQKMRRLVRDVSRKANKNVELIISGEDTELDKNVIQQISDPLVHMVRNAVDHGIEGAEQRRAAGKPEAGRVYLDAYHQGDSIVIEIRDDGRGLDPQKLIAKGIERGLVAPSDPLSDAQAFALILQPGFSTAEKVTDISGRGVGMDVVRRNVEQLRGKIEIHSTVGKGSTFLIRLPLTLAIIDGMIVKLGEERLIIPTILIEQSLRPERKQITSVQRRGQLLQVRGELCPIIQLGMLFDYAPPLDPSEHLVVIVQSEGQKVALVVEELIGQQQVVIKTLGERFKQVQGVSGAAILGDGRVGLILEPGGLLALHNRVGTAYVFDRPAGAARQAELIGDPGACHANVPTAVEVCPPDRGRSDDEVDGPAAESRVSAVTVMTKRVHPCPAGPATLPE